MTEDQILVQRAQQGDKVAFRELVERYKKKIYYLAYDLTGNFHDAEDLSQEVFIKMFRFLPRFRGEAKLSSWLYRITVNTYLSRRRRNQVSSLLRLESFAEEGENLQNFQLDDNRSSPEQAAEETLMQQHIEQALSKLTPRERSIFTLRHYHDLPLKEIAVTLKINLGTVKSLLFRALKKMQTELAFYKEELAVEVSDDKLSPMP